MNTVLIADDHKIMRQGLHELLSEIPGISVIGTATDGAETLSKLNTLSPDLLILDISMPVMDGFEVLKNIRRKGFSVKVVVLSMHKDARTIKRALEEGVDGFVLKDEAFDTLATCIISVLKGGNYLSPGSRNSLATLKGSTSTQLTAREREIVELIAEGKASKEIAAELGITLKTVENHRQNIMGKLQLHKATEIVRYAMKEGIL